MLQTLLVMGASRPVIENPITVKLTLTMQFGTGGVHGDALFPKMQGIDLNPQPAPAQSHY